MRGAVERWKRESGGVLRASYERLRADQSAVGAAVLVAEGPVLSTADTSWFRPDPAPAPRPSFRRGRVAAVVPRTPAAVQAVNLGTLERIVVPPLLDKDELANIAKAGFTGADVRGAPVVQRDEPGFPAVTFRIRTESSTLSHLRVGTYEAGGGWSPSSEHGVHVSCRPHQLDGLAAARWQTATPRAAGLEVSIHDGWFQESRCRAGLVRSAVAMARPLDDAGLIYGLRACESEACEVPSLLLVLPRAGSVLVSGKGAAQDRGGATFVRLPLGVGTSTTVLARIAMSALVEWERSRVSAGLPSRLSAMGTDLPASVQVGVDVIAAPGEPMPDVVVYRNRIAPFVR